MRQEVIMRFKKKPKISDKKSKLLDGNGDDHYREKILNTEKGHTYEIK